MSLSLVKSGSEGRQAGGPERFLNQRVAAVMAASRSVGES